MNNKVVVVGAGLAGCEAAWQLAIRDIKVVLVDMKPGDRSPAHSSPDFAELVCSNSFRSDFPGSAVGLLKRELEHLGSLLIETARKTSVPAGKALAVDRKLFSLEVEKRIASHPNISIEQRKLTELPDEQCIIATGPLTDGGLALSLGEEKDIFHYHDAIAPCVAADSLDLDKLFFSSRYDTDNKGDYLNAPMDEKTYYKFADELVNAKKTPLRDFENSPFFEGCLPVEELARRGKKTLAYGPMKPVGLTDPKTGRQPFAVVQLRTENLKNTAFNLVGFQTRLVRSEQNRIFRMIPGLEKAVFERFGQIHRNSFLNAPATLDNKLRLISDKKITLAGQLAGVEGYVESIACGLAAGIYKAALLKDIDAEIFDKSTATGGLLNYLKIPQGRFQPSNVIWSMIETGVKPKKMKRRDFRLHSSEKALHEILRWKDKNKTLFDDLKLF